VPERRPVGFGQRSADAAEAGPAHGKDERPWPAGATRLDDELASSLLPARPARGHKGSFGKLLVIAGSLDYAGAALLVCRAAGRAGVGLVTLAVPESLQTLFAGKVVEATTMGLPEDDFGEIDPDGALARILDHEHDAIVIGPGLRPGLATADLVRELMAASGEAPPPLVVDAEALRSLATMDRWWDGERRPAILTPHAGEFARLRAGSGRDPAADGDLRDDDDARVAAARDAASSWHQVVVLKGARTVIAAPDGEVAVAPFENPALATGGTGDVLAGAIGALLAQGVDPYAAARLGVYLHGGAGDAARERIGEAGVLASDLPDGLAYTRRRLATLAERRRSERRLGFGARPRSSAAAAAPPEPSAPPAAVEPAAPGTTAPDPTLPA
jgi:NAD(P)H-hydrate epimerase